ncbi:hypothetical protein COEREDRAFT_51929 [Coemansia reversa NRRL 1564]|uniref:Probable DNA polymerase n=1 Tax=Coemansia reversa (strain ATCC 12441 / NRRL 1564) TaxID=763665 RepID=A0A2G5B0L3_COERN|nr:hypothetical protein COEREDRAFT_51929 [Coemansia reversa NRRL 1564]|eukprot:PIA12554.1 hypothetical protein COEREDRAFT_51929 [Coemansia reversa NRRL 1564]
MHYYLQRIESVENWSFSNRPVTRIMKFKDFHMFTANDLSRNCQRQIVEYFGEVWDASKTLDEMLAPRKVIRGHPGHKRIDQVDTYSDLTWDYHEDVATTDCVNIVRIVEYNAHVGLITSIKRRPSPFKKILKRLPYTTPRDETIPIFVDIEAFESPQPGKYKLQVPYLICWTWPNPYPSDKDVEEGYEVVRETGPGCVEKFVIRLLESYEDCEICLYAWYGSGYDYQHIYKYLKDRCEDDTTYVRNNAIIYAKFKMGNKLTIHLKDPFLFILCSLDKAAKAFGVMNKGTFPHEVIKDWDDLDKVIKEWYVVRRSTVETVEGKTILVTANNWNEVVEINNTSTVLQKAIEYCTVDVLAMRQVWTKFCKLVEQHLSVKISPKIFTLSQLSMKIMMATLPKHINLHVPDREEYNFMYSAIYGGRVVARNGAYEEAIVYADVVSLYPSAMKLLDHPHGNAQFVKSINWNKIGIYEVVLTSGRRPERYSEFVPFRDSKGKLSYNWRAQWQGSYHTYDLLIAREEGYNIKCIRGMEWNKGKLFDTFVDKLFKMKAETPCQCTVKCPGKCAEGGPIRMVAKIALNGGGYGKFVQKPIDTDLYVVQKGVVHGAFERMEKNSEGMVVKARHVINMPKFYPLDDAWDKMVVEDPEALPQYPTQVGISILSASRYRLYNLCKQCTEKSMDVIYSDTDSIFVRKSTVDWDLFKSKCGTELGQLDDTIGNTQHGTINRMYIAGPKMYAYEYHDHNGLPQQVVHCKGIRNKDLDMRHFEWLCKDVDYKIKYNMMVMAKNLVSVRTQNIDKEIKQT